MKIGIIGCGLIGRKRAIALESNDKLVACCDINEDIGKKFSNDFKCIFYKNYIDLLANTDCDIIIVSVINKYTKEIVIAALKTFRHVLVEKPMGINYNESNEILSESIINKQKIKVGFNHRFHPAIVKAKDIFDVNGIGKIMFIRAFYGHGGRPGMENEWRASKELCGGGELLDQGIHLIDLSRWFAGDIKSVFGTISTKFWNIEVEDNAFMLLKSKSDVDIQLHVSWTNWKNNFQFEIYGTNGYLKITGLGGWYGEEKLEFGKRKKEGGVPKIEIFEFNKKDISWKNEWKNFKSSLIHEFEPLGNVIDGVETNKIINAVYESSSKNKIINL